MIYEEDQIKMFEQAKRRTRNLVKPHVPKNWEYQINSDLRYPHGSKGRQLYWVVRFKYNHLDFYEFSFYWHPCASSYSLEEFHFNASGSGVNLDKIFDVVKDIPEIKKCVSVIVESMNPKNL